MARRQRATHEPLVAKRDVEDGAAARNKEPLVAVGDEEVGIQLLEIEGDVADAMGAVDQA